jgi:DNA-binding IclR family transcriptional regulator
VEVYGETAHVGVPDGVEVVYVDKVETRIRFGCTVGWRSIADALHGHGEGDARVR